MDTENNISYNQNVEKYPPLIIFKDVSCQTDISLSIRRQHTKLIRIRDLILYLFLLYSLFCISVIFSVDVQSLLVYCNFIHYPSPNLTDLQRHGLNQARNIEITTSDGLLLKGWHLLPPGKVSISAAKITNVATREMYFTQKLLSAERVVVFFHGTAGDRSSRNRIPLAKQIAAHLSAHVISFDYRGFGDSEGWPSEVGTRLDAVAVLEWLYQQKYQNNDTLITNLERRKSESLACVAEVDATNEELSAQISSDRLHPHAASGAHLSGVEEPGQCEADERTASRTTSRPHVPSVFLYGQSLGAAVALQLAALLDDQLFYSLPALALSPRPIALPGLVRFTPAAGIHEDLSAFAVQGVILDAPFSTLANASLYHPIGAIFRIFPIVSKIMLRSLRIFYRNVDSISRTRLPVLIIHGQADGMIPISEARVLLEAGNLSGRRKDTIHSPSENSVREQRVSLVEVKGAGHTTVFNSAEWLVEVPRFVESSSSFHMKKVKALRLYCSS